VQLSGTCTQSVMSMTCIRSDLMGRERQTKHAQSDFIQGERIEAGRTWRPSKCECVGHSCKKTVCRHHPQRAPSLFKFPSLGANDIKAILGIEKCFRQELLSLTEMHT